MKQKQDMEISRRQFMTIATLSGMGIMTHPIGCGMNVPDKHRLKLDQSLIEQVKGNIEREIINAMEKIYLPGKTIFDESYRPGSKYIERVVSYYDYQACGISVLAVLAKRGNEKAQSLMKQIQDNITYYRENIFEKEMQDYGFWNVPLRRLLLHLALACRELEPVLSSEEKKIYRDLAEEQVPLAIEHNKNFFPGEVDLYMTTNNHTAIFMQGIYYCGKVFNHPEWVDITVDFANRMYDSVHPDGYFEEMSNKERQLGPSLVYTPLTLGSLYDVLDGKKNSQDKFIKAGDFYRSFVNYDYQKIPIADERTNSNGKGVDYGLALHSLTSGGRYYIADNLTNLDFSRHSVEMMAVIYHELNLMRQGNSRLPENRTEGNSRISLPLGIIRKDGFTAGISGLLALNRTLYPKHDYHLDQQNMVYLSHEKAGVILTGFKSKNDPGFSTFRIGDDAYTIKMGELNMGKGWAEATLHYKTFTAKIRWEISDSAKLILTTDSDKTITTSLPIIDEKYLKSDKNFKIEYLRGFSPYSQNNEAGNIKTAVFEWEKELVIEFKV